MKLNGLYILYKNMKLQSIEKCRFEYQNKKGKFDVFFFIDEDPFILLFGAKGGNFSFEVDVHKGFKIEPKFEKEIYYKLIKFIEIMSNKDDLFKPFNFFVDFNQKIPKQISKSNLVKPHQLIKYRKDVEEANKIYFLKWLNNTNGHKVTIENLNKTKQILGKRAYEICKKKNISSCWTDDKNKAKEFYLPN
jgi:hypothetical protein